MSSKTYGAWIDEGAHMLNAAGIEDARAEARRLIELVTGLSAAELIMKERELLSDSDLIAQLHDAIGRRARREPFAHIAGERDFYGLSFLSDHRALVPRPDSESVVEAALSVLDEDRPLLVADLGTGTGCLLVAILKHRPNARGVGIERDEGACALARENLVRHGLEDTARIVNLDWADWDGWQSADLIVSNPPYIARGVIDELDPEVRVFDPFGALDGGADGLDAYRALIALGADRMKAGSWMVLEIGYDQGETVPALLQSANFRDIELKQDLGGRDRVVLARLR